MRSRALRRPALDESDKPRRRQRLELALAWHVRARGARIGLSRRPFARAPASRRCATSLAARGNAGLARLRRSQNFAWRFCNSLLACVSNHWSGRSRAATLRRATVTPMSADGLARLGAARRRRAIVAALAIAASGGCGHGTAEPSADRGTSTTSPAATDVVRGSVELGRRVGGSVVIAGTAETARAGAAVVFEDGTPVYVGGLRAWTARLQGRRVEVRGVLRRRASQVPRSAEQSGGLGETYTLERARWKLRDSRG